MHNYRQQLIRIWKKYQYWLAWAAVLLYNNWLLSLLLNPHATAAGATTSELGATDQPWNMVFRVLDSLSGLLFLLGAGAIIKLGTSARLRGLLAFAVGVLGLSTIAESLLFPLNCSSALSRACEQAEATGMVDWQHSFHIMESVVSYVILAFLPLALLLVLRHRQNAYRLKEWSYGLLAFMLLWGVETLIKYMHNAGSYGIEQRFFIVIFSIWYLQALRLSRRGLEKFRQK